jgi:hypothetical protein
MVRPSEGLKVIVRVGRASGDRMNSPSGRCTECWNVIVSASTTERREAVFITGASLLVDAGVSVKFS